MTPRASSTPLNDDSHKHTRYMGAGGALFLLAAMFVLLMFSLRVSYDTNCRITATERGAEDYVTAGLVNWSCTLTFADGRTVRLEKEGVWP